MGCPFTHKPLIYSTIDRNLHLQINLALDGFIASSFSSLTKTFLSCSFANSHQALGGIWCHSPSEAYQSQVFNQGLLWVTWIGDIQGFLSCRHKTCWRPWIHRSFNWSSIRVVTDQFRVKADQGGFSESHRVLLGWKIIRICSRVRQLGKIKVCQGRLIRASSCNI